MARLISTGCTVTNTFTLPCAPADIAVLYITYVQGGQLRLEKQLEDVTLTEKEAGAEATVRLSQQDTLRFRPEDGPVRIQLRLRTRRDTALKSRIVTAAVDEVLKEGVI